MSTKTKRQNAALGIKDFERRFVGDRRINVTHFYSVGDGPLGVEFAVGYFTHDGFFMTGLVRWVPDLERFVTVY